MFIPKLYEDKVCDITIRATVTRASDRGTRHISYLGCNGNEYSIPEENLIEILRRDSLKDYDLDAVYEDSRGEVWRLEREVYSSEPTGKWTTFGVKTAYEFDYPLRPLKKLS